MDKNTAYCYAQNNHSTSADSVPSEILQETNLSVVRAYLEGLYQSQDFGSTSYLECDHYKFACGIQHLWTKFNIRTDRIMPLTKDTGTRNIVRPESIHDFNMMTDILYRSDLCEICFRGIIYGNPAIGYKCSYCDNR